MSEYITRQEHDEFAKRMEDEHARASKRITIVENEVRESNKLIIAVNKLASAIEGMQRELGQQGERIEKIEQIPADNWKVLKSSILSAIGGVIGTAIVAAIISFVK